MRALLLLIVFCICKPCLQAQTSPGDFVAYRDEDKTVAYLNDFSDAKQTCWQNCDAVIKDGMCYVFNKTNIVRANFCELEFDYSRDFEIEIKAKVDMPKTSGKQHGILSWGRIGDKLPSGQFFYFTGNRRYLMAYTTEGAEKMDYVERARHSEVDDDFNIFTIRKVGSKYYVFINGSFSDEFPYFPLTGSRVGLGASDGVSATFDYIKMSYLKGRQG